MDVKPLRYLILAVFTIGYLFSSVCIAQTIVSKTTPTKSAIKYWEYLPKNYHGTKENLPVIFFLHGKGERGDGTEASLDLVLKHGPLQQAKNNNFDKFYADGKAYNFIVLAPQLDQPATYWSPEYVDEFINYCLQTYQINTNRMYLTGLSMGGNGTWNYAYSSYNAINKFAAIAPIASWGNSNKVCLLKERNIPVWAFHGEDDKTVAFSRGKEIFETLKKCESGVETDYRFTAYRATGHNSWQKAYDQSHKWNSPNIYEWFLSHELNKGQSNTLTQTLQLQNSTVAVKSDEDVAVLEVVCSLPASLHEISGLATDSNGNLWAHNDSYNGPYLMQIDTSGNVNELKKVIYSSNFDWEDLAAGDNGKLYIGDIGNNENIRKKLYIYEVAADDSAKRVKAKTISFSYPDQKDFPPAGSNMNFDSEAMLYFNDSLYIFTKNRTVPYNGVVKIYKVPAIEGEQTAILVDSLQLDTGSMYDNWITAADISPDGKTIALLSHRKLWLISCFDKTKFSESHIQRIMLDSFSQKEAITFIDNENLYIADEKFKKMLGGNLYKLNIADWLSPKCD